MHSGVSNRNLWSTPNPRKRLSLHPRTLPTLRSIMKVSVIIPAKDEEKSIGRIIEDVRHHIAPHEIIVVDDGSRDQTAETARRAGAITLSHPYNLGNGAAIKTGVRNASGDILGFMDADGQHRAEDLRTVLATLAQGNELVVGARTRRTHQSSPFRWLANLIYNKLASWLVGQPVLDLTSGLRAANAKHFKDILSLLPNGYSYPTTSTMAFFRSGLPVAFVPIHVNPRGRAEGSHIRPLRDGARFFGIIFKMATLYSPLKIFGPTSAILFGSAVAYYAYTYLSDGRFTNMGVLLAISSVFALLIGLISEQITTLIYMQLNPAAASTRPKPPND